MRETRQWQRWVPLIFAAIALIALTLLPAWATVLAVAGLAVLYLILSPVRVVPPSRP
ncbi:Uncharacterised protein [Mycobacterium tuberculosis]|nr:Uncharacterised protein [Mycobacterium tuberculosis]